MTCYPPTTKWYQRVTKVSPVIDSSVTTTHLHVHVHCITCMFINLLYHQYILNTGVHMYMYVYLYMYVCLVDCFRMFSLSHSSHQIPFMYHYLCHHNHSRHSTLHPRNSALLCNDCTRRSPCVHQTQRTR